MKLTRDERRQLAVQLPPEERPDLADLLWASAHSPEEVVAAWIAEAERRADGLDAGHENTVSFEESVERLRSRIRSGKK